VTVLLSWELSQSSQPPDGQPCLLLAHDWADDIPYALTDAAYAAIAGCGPVPGHGLQQNPSASLM
jgi:hypothetical protein